MTTIKDVIAEIKKCDSEDFSIEEVTENYVTVMFYDFWNIGDDWDINDWTYREYNDQTAVDSLLAYLKKTCNSYDDPAFEYYYYNGFTVEVQFESFLHI